MNEQEFEQQVKTAIDAGVPELDELSRARLRAARHQAVAAAPESAGWFWFRPALVFASAALVAVLSWQLFPQPDAIELAEASDTEVISDLDLMLWLEEGDASL